MINLNANTILVISDTHGLFRDELESLCSKSDLIIHAGDIGNANVIKLLEKFSPVIAVHGNTDSLQICQSFPEERQFMIHGKTFFLTHIPTNIIPNINGSKPDFVIFGHTHQPKITKSNHCLVINPGSCGPKRFNLPTSALVLKFNQELNHFDIAMINL
ncbi:MAG: metallophosphoesterase family protein [Lentisphaeria bacterium]